MKSNDCSIVLLRLVRARRDGMEQRGCAASRGTESKPIHDGLRSTRPTYVLLLTDSARLALPASGVAWNCFRNTGSSAAAELSPGLGELDIEGTVAEIDLSGSTTCTVVPFCSTLCQVTSAPILR